MTYVPCQPIPSLLSRVVASTLLGGAALLGSACGDTVTDVPTPAGSEVGVTSEIDGEAIYRGLFFGRGELGSLAAEVWLDNAPPGDRRSDDAELVATAHTLQDDMVRWIGRNEPAFFGELHAAATSGNHVRVDRMLDRASSVSLAAFEEVADSGIRASLEMDAVSADEAAIVVVVYRTVAAAVHAVVVVWRIKVVAPMADGGAVSALERDESVARLVSALEGV